VLPSAQLATWRTRPGSFPPGKAMPPACLPSPTAGTWPRPLSGLAFGP